MILLGVYFVFVWMILLGKPLYLEDISWMMWLLVCGGMYLEVAKGLLYDVFFSLQ